MPKMGLMLMKLLEFCQEVLILKSENYLMHPFVPQCTVWAKILVHKYCEDNNHTSHCFGAPR